MQQCHCENAIVAFVMKPGPAMGCLFQNLEHSRSYLTAHRSQIILPPDLELRLHVRSDLSSISTTSATTDEPFKALYPGRALRDVLESFGVREGQEEKFIRTIQLCIEIWYISLKRARDTMTHEELSRVFISGWPCAHAGSVQCTSRFAPLRSLHDPALTRGRSQQNLKSKACSICSQDMDL